MNAWVVNVTYNSIISKDKATNPDRAQVEDETIVQFIEEKLDLNLNTAVPNLLVPKTKLQWSKIWKPLLPFQLHNCRFDDPRSEKVTQLFFVTFGASGLWSSI